MGCRGQRPLWSWVLWGLWVLPGKCWGRPRRCWADQVADTIWVTGDGLRTILRLLER